MFDLESCVEITLKTPDDFLKVRETLSRIGVASRKEKILYQSCHILHKRGRYFILHFKQLFALDGKPTDISENDVARTNAIARLLAEWGLVVLMKPESLVDVAPLHQIKIITHKEKPDWQLVTKYTIGKKRVTEEPER
jgi:Bacteriophage translational regulator